MKVISEKVKSIFTKVGTNLPLMSDKSIFNKVKKAFDTYRELKRKQLKDRAKQCFLNKLSWYLISSNVSVLSNSVRTLRAAMVVPVKLTLAVNVVLQKFLLKICILSGTNGKGVKVAPVRNKFKKLTQMQPEE